MHAHTNARVWNFVGRAGFSSDGMYVRDGYSLQHMEVISES